MKSEQEIRARIERLELERKEVSDMFYKEIGYDVMDYCDDLSEIEVERRTLLWVLRN